MPSMPVGGVSALCGDGFSYARCSWFASTSGSGFTRRPRLPCRLFQRAEANTSEVVHTQRLAKLLTLRDCLAVSAKPRPERRHPSPIDSLESALTQVLACDPEQVAIAARRRPVDQSLKGRAGNLRRGGDSDAPAVTEPLAECPQLLGTPLEWTGGRDPRGRLLQYRQYRLDPFSVGEERRLERVDAGWVAALRARLG